MSLERRGHSSHSPNAEEGLGVEDHEGETTPIIIHW